jgi:hypothetical protein
VAEKPYLRGRLSKIELRVLTSLEQLFFKIENIIYPFFKKNYPNEVVNRTEPSLLVSVPY